MGIGIQRESCREMAQHSRHGFHIHAVLEGQCGERMAEIVEPDLRQARPIQHPVEHMEDAVRGNGAASGAREYIGATGLLFPLLLQNAYRIRP